MGKRITTMTNYKTLEYTDKVATEQKAAIERLLELLPPYVREYAEYKEPKLAIKTRREYIQDIFSFFSFMVDVIPECKNYIIKEIPLETLSSLSLDDFSAYERWLMSESKGGGYNSPTTIKRKQSSLRSFYGYLYASDRIAVNPVAKIESVRVDSNDRDEIRVLTDKERQLFLAAIDKEYEDAVEKLEEAKAKAEKNDKPVAEAIRIKPALAKRNKAIVYLFLGTGLRNSELCAINCEDFSVDNEKINVIRKGKGKNKKKKKEAYVLLGTEVIHVLLEYLTEYREVIGPDTDNYDAMFLSSRHTRITPRAIEQMVEKYANEALGKKNGVHPHVLRASFGDKYQATYKNILATSEVMNHSSTAVTAQYYLKRSEKSKEDAKKIPIL